MKIVFMFVISDYRVFGRCFEFCAETSSRMVDVGICECWLLILNGVKSLGCLVGACGIIVGTGYYSILSNVPVIKAC